MNFRSKRSIGIFLLFLMISSASFAQESIKESEQLEFAQGLLTRGMYDMAILQYQKFISDYPNSTSLSEAYLSLGEVYFLSQDFNKAIETFNQFMQRYPNSEQLPVGLLRLGQIDIQQKRYDEALKKFLSIDQGKLKGEMLQSFDFYTAQAYEGLADPASALKYYQKSVDDYGQGSYTAYALKEMGKIDVASSHFKEAMDAYTRSIAAAKDNNDLKEELTYRLAELQFLSGQFDDAVKGFEALLDQYPNSGFAQDAMSNMFLAYFNSGRYQDLLNAYQQKAKQIKEDESSYRIHMSAVLADIELKKYQEANAILDKVLVFSGLKSSEKARIFIKKADILIRQKKYMDALSLLGAYSSENTDDADENLFLMAQAYFGTGDFDKSFNLFENVYLNFPNSRYSKAALLGEAHARKETQRFKESEVLFLKYYEIQDQPDLKSEALYDAVMMALKAGDDQEVISLAQEFLKAFPNSDQKEEILLILADHEGQNNHPQDAINLLQGYLSSNPLPKRPNAANFLLGFNQELLGHSDEALASYAKVDPKKEEGKFYVAALKNTAIIYLGQKNLAQAKVFFDRLISGADQNDLQVKTYIWVCNEYLKEQKYDDVLRIAAEAEKRFPVDQLLEINYFKAEAERGLGDCQDAEKGYDLVTASTPKNAYTGQAHIGYGLCLVKDQKFDDARQEFQKSLDENSDDVVITIHARFEMANTYAAQGKFDEALKFYLLVATIYDDDYYCSQSLLNAGQILERQKRRADALKMYSEILDKYKNSAAAVEAKERVRLLK